jgi:tripartite-type tricarboxylate transporter receptor subunit TctC
MMMTGLAAARPLIDAKRIKPLGILGNVRSPELPEVPTLKEQGLDLPELNMGSWWGIMVPTGTPRPVVEKLSAALTALLDDPVVVARIGKLNIEPRKSTPGEFANFVRSQREVWSKLIEPVR